MDITSRGSIQYEVHTGSASSFLLQVSDFISNYTDGDFAGTWMLVVQWDQVPPYPGSISTVVSFYNVIEVCMSTHYTYADQNLLVRVE